MAIVGDYLVPFPLTQDYEAPLSYVLPLVIGLILAYTSYTDDPLHIATSTRPVMIIHISRLALQIIVTSLPCLLVYALLTDRSDLLVGLRNILFMVGICLITSRFVSPGWFWMAPVGYMLAVFTMGVDPSNKPFSWAIPLLPFDSVLALTASFAALLLGIFTQVLTGRLAPRFHGGIGH